MVEVRTNTENGMVRYVFEGKPTLRQLREAHCMKPRVLEEALGLSKSAVNAYEIGVKTPPLKRALQIAKMFGVKVEDVDWWPVRKKEE